MWVAIKPYLNMQNKSQQMRSLPVFEFLKSDDFCESYSGNKTGKVNANGQ